jgi:hypothetical protein
MDWFKKAVELSTKGYNYREISDKLRVPYGTVKSRFSRAKRKNVVGEEERTPVISDCGDYYVVSSGKRSVEISKQKLREIKLLYCDESPLTINQICRRLNIQRRDFMLIKSAFNITHDDVPYIDDDLTDDNIDSLVETTLERRKEKYFEKLNQAEVKRLRAEVNKFRTQEYFIELIHDATTEFFDSFNKTYEGPVISHKPCNNGLMLEVPIVDLHLGKLAWAGETGDNYDHRIAEERFMIIINDVVGRNKGRNIEKIVFPVGNDFFNFDTVEGATTAGTLQNNDLRWQKLYTKGLELLIKGVDALSTIAPVELIYVPGNHDKMTSFYAVVSLSCWYRASEIVIVNTNPMARKYIEFGKCLIGYTHLDKEKKRIEGNMQIEAAEAWGRTLFREWHGAHLHSEHVREVNGIKIRNLSAATGTDAWHYESGYVGSVLTSQSFVWDKERGLIEILYTPIVK